MPFALHSVTHTRTTAGDAAGLDRVRGSLRHRGDGGVGGRTRMRTRSLLGQQNAPGRRGLRASRESLRLILLAPCFAEAPVVLDN